VFVRSDTNVEDLPGFTGAGLNLTVFNVVGFEAVLEAIRRVWASPFTDRAFGWRQSLMDTPEHVYASVLLHQTVPAAKSGVMVTADLATNHPGSYSIAVSEGLGGGVEGQATESLRVDAGSGEARLLASAGEPQQWIALRSGGTRRAPSSGSEQILQNAEIEMLVALGRSLALRYPVLLDAEGRPAPADIEFAFYAGRLYLIQIRPFLQSDRAQRNRVLAALDVGLRDSADRPVDLGQPPAQAAP
jgi:phosphoenolpyruvate synthase/pyruvate phosphate dikinase